MSRELDPNNNNSNEKVGALTTLFQMLIMWPWAIAAAVRWLPNEIYFFFHSDRNYKYCPHFLTYWGWMITYLGLALALYSVLTFLFGSGTVGSLFGGLFFGGMLIFSVSKIYARSVKCTNNRGLLSWHPGVGYIHKDNYWTPMPWAKLIPAWCPTLGPHNRVQKAEHAARLAIADDFVAKGQSKTAPQEVKKPMLEYLPVPEYVPLKAEYMALLEATVLRGTKILNGYKTRLQWEAEAKARGEGGYWNGYLNFGPIFMHRDDETKHILLAGSTGSGKTQQMETLLRTIRNIRHEPAIIIDPDGGYFSRFGDNGIEQDKKTGDILLNPFDVRTSQWNLFREIKNPLKDCPLIAKTLIPNEGDGVWSGYARTLLTWILIQLFKNGKESHKISEVIHYCFSATAVDLKKLLKGTVAETFAEEKGAMLNNTRNVMTKYLTPFQLLVDDGDFSIREFVRQSDKSKGRWLFMTYTDTQLESLKYLLATWSELALLESLELSESDSRRLWIILDEFDSLGRCESVKIAASKLRKHGVSLIIAIQAASQMIDNYGQEDATTIFSCLRTKCLLNQGDAESAKHWSNELGEHEVNMLKISRTSGQTVSEKNSSNSGSSEHMEQKIQAAVLPSELQGLSSKPIHSFLRLPGSSDVYLNIIPYMKMEKKNPPFLAHENEYDFYKDGGA